MYGRQAGFLLIIITFFSCDPENSLKKTGEHEIDLPGTDSMVVEQLIERSKEHYAGHEDHVEVVDNYMREAEALAIKNQNNFQLAHIYILIGQRYRNLSRYGEAMELHQKALQHATMAGDKALLGETYNQIGVDYRRMDDNPMALEMHVKAFSLAEESGDSVLLSKAVNSIGNVNYNLERYTTSIEYFKRGLELSERMGNHLGLAINHHNLGESLLKSGKTDSAFGHFFTSLDYNYEMGNRLGQSICLNSIGSAFILLNRPHKALEYLTKAVEINQTLTDRMQVAMSYSKMGEAHLMLNQPEEADTFLTKARDIAREIGSLFQVEDASRLLSRLYEQQGDFARSLEHFKSAAAYRDSIINEKNIHHLSIQEAVLNSEQQRARIEELNKQTLRQKSILERQRFFIVAGLVVIIAISFGIVMFIRQSQVNNRYKNIRHQQRLLRSQMNPHFIFNALNAIQGYVLNHDIEKSSRFLTDFALLMRQVLHSSSHDYITLKQEIEILDYYLKIQRLRFSSTFSYDLHVDPNLNQELLLVPPMLAQPFIENAIEHGIRPLGTDGYIRVSFAKNDDKMEVTVDDNGIGIESSRQITGKNPDHKSMAINITRERLSIFGRDAKGRTALLIQDKKQLDPLSNGTLVQISFPLLKSNQNKNLIPESGQARSLLKAFR